MTEETIVCEYEHCRKIVEEYDSFVLEWHYPSEHEVSQHEERHFFCSFKCGANYMHRCEYG